MSTSDNTINVLTREETGKGVARRLRAEGKVPAIMYGHGKAAANLAIETTQVLPFLHHTGLIKLKIEGEKTAKTAIIKDYQMNMLNHRLVHVDFMEVRANEVISATVEVLPHGTAVGIASGGMLDQLLYSVEIRGAANKLPESIVADISELDVGDTLTLSDLELPDGVEAVGGADQIVFSLHLPKVEAAAEEEAEGEEAEGEEEAVAEEAAE